MESRESNGIDREEQDPNIWGNWVHSLNKLTSHFINKQLKGRPKISKFLPRIVVSMQSNKKKKNCLSIYIYIYI